jgi:hypothetical protein
MNVDNLNFNNPDRITDSLHQVKERNLQSLGAASGIMAVLLMVVLTIVGAPAFEEVFDFQSSAQQFGASIDKYRQTLGLVNFLVGLIGLFLLGFTGSLKTTLKRAEGEPGLLSTAAYTAGALWAFVWILYAALVSSAMELPGFYQNPEGAKTIFPVAFHMLFSPVILLLPATLLGATAIVILRTQGLPRWLGWVSGLFALLNILAAGLGLIFGAPAILLTILFPLWIVAASIVLIRKGS